MTLDCESQCVILWGFEVGDLVATQEASSISGALFVVRILPFIVYFFWAMVVSGSTALSQEDRVLDPSKNQLFHTNLAGGGLIDGACHSLSEDGIVRIKTVDGKWFSIPLELFEKSEQDAIVSFFEVEPTILPAAEKGTDRNEQHPWHSIRGGVLCFGKIVSVRDQVMSVVDADGRSYRVPLELLAQGALAHAEKDIAKLDPSLVVLTPNGKRNKSNTRNPGASVPSKPPAIPREAPKKEQELQSSTSQPMSPSPKVAPPTNPNSTSEPEANGPMKREQVRDQTPLGNHRKWQDNAGATLATGKFQRRTNPEKLVILDQQGQATEVDFKQLAEEHKNYVQLVEAGGRIDIASDAAAIRREIPAEKLREWRMMAGLSIAKGEFLELKNGNVIIFEPTQRTKEIPLELLSDADKQYAQAMASGEGPGEPPEGSIAIDSDSAKLLPALDGKHLLLVDNDQLKLLSDDGRSLVASHRLPTDGELIAERKEYYVVCHKNSLTLLDKESFEIIGTHELWKFQGINDIALHPKRKVAFLSVTNSVDEIRKNSDERNRVVQIDETTGKVTLLGDIHANWIRCSPSGDFLVAGYKRVDSRYGGFHINPDGNIIDTPKWDNTDILRRFNINNGSLKLDEEFPNAGANGQGLVLSPNGKQIAYLSFTGYPTLSYNIAILDARNFEKKPVSLATKDLASCKLLAIHPTRPLAACPGGEAVVFFDTRNGKPIAKQPEIQNSLHGCIVHQLVFNRDGSHLILQASKGGGQRFVASVPLQLGDITSDASIANPTPTTVEANETLRTWTDKSGKFQVEAEFIKIAGENVLLKKKDGTTIEVPLQKLTSKDQVIARKMASDSQ